MKNKSLGLYNIIDTEGINKSINNVLSSGINFNTYTSPKGLKELRMQISNFLYDIWNYNVNYKDMLITTGSQQSINLIAYSLLNEGDTVLIEQPTYFGAINAFKNRKVKLVGIDLDEEGFDLKELEVKIIKYHPKLIYVTPTFNNPTGYSWSNNYRKKFLEIINKYDVLVLEDDPYSLINYTKYQYKSLYELNNGKNIIYLGTFAKYISPSINVGYIISNDSILKTIYSFKESFDLCTPLFAQLIVLDYLQNNNIKELIDNRISIYKKLLDETIAYINNNYAESILSYSKVRGGLFISIKFKEKIDNYVFESGDNYYIDKNHNNETRINICNILFNKNKRNLIDLETNKIWGKRS
ncbi:MAG: PLP-dependent aminotransferase family protein [Bacilli bacterium]|nr:PLP-dependent aminotransferase family protein [Bacilli bacterium]